MRVFFALFLLLMAISGCAQAVREPPVAPQRAESAQAYKVSKEELFDFIEHYYLAPDPPAALNRFLFCDITAFLRDPVVENRGRKMTSMSVFFAHILRQEPNWTMNFVNRTGGAGTAQHILVMAVAVAWADSYERKRIALSSLKGEYWFRMVQSEKTPGLAQHMTENLFDRFEKFQPFPFPDMTPREVGDLDVMWTSFFASGDHLYIEKILQVLVQSPSDVPDHAGVLKEDRLLTPDKQQAPRHPIQDAAASSLKAKARDHAAVRDILTKIAEEQSGDLGKVAGELLSTLAMESGTRR